jgi:hypothetical protein
VENGFEIYKIADKQEKEYEDIFGNLDETRQIKPVNVHQPVLKQKTPLPELFLRIDNFKWISFVKNIPAL